MKTIFKNYDFHLANHEDLLIDVNSGNGQLSTAAFYDFNDNPVLNSNSISDVSVLRQCLVGNRNQAETKKKITLTITSRDLNPRSNKIEIDVLINDISVCSLSETADKDGDQIVHFITINFK